MTSKERVLTGLASRPPDRVPINYSANPGLGDIINSNGMLRGMEQVLVDLAKHYDLPVMIHTCGSSSWVYEDFIAMGVRVADTIADCRNALDIMMPGGGYCFAPTHALQDDSPTANVVAIYAPAHEAG